MKAIVIAIIVVLGLLLNSNSFACNVCHSKNPKMVNMHKALEFKDCFTCHGPMASKPLEDRKKQRESDPVCSRCHKK